MSFFSSSLVSRESTDTVRIDSLIRCVRVTGKRIGEDSAGQKGGTVRSVTPNLAADTQLQVVGGPRENRLRA